MFRAISTRPTRAFTLRFLCACALGLSLAGCDKCGDWFWVDGSAPHTCKDAPSQR